MLALGLVCMVAGCMRTGFVPPAADAAIPADGAVPDAEAPPRLAWSVEAAGSSKDISNAVTMDPAGNVYVSGWFFKAAAIGSVSLTSQGQFDAYVASLSPQGSLRWSRQFKSPGSVNATSTAASAASVVVAGVFDGTMDLGSGPWTTAGGWDIFLAWLDPQSGAITASAHPRGPQGDFVGAVAATQDGGLVVVGYFTDELDLDATTKLTGSGGRDGYVASYDASGALRWQHQIGSAGDDWGFAVTVDGAGNTYAGGWFRDTVDLGGGSTLTSAGGTDGYVVSYDSSGTLRWAQRVGGPSDDMVSGVDVRGAHVRVAGFFQQTLPAAGSGTLTSAGGKDVYVRAYTTAGAELWTRRLGGASDDQSREVAVDAQGVTTVTGCLQGTSQLDDGSTLSSAGQCDVLLARYDAQGTLLSARLFGATGDDWGRDVVAHERTIYLTGTFQDQIDWGAGPVVAAGNEDGFLAKLEFP